MMAMVKFHDYTSHVDTRDFIRAFWIKNSADQYLEYHGGGISWSEDTDVSNRVLMMHLSSRGKFALLTQTDGYIAFNEKFEMMTTSVLSKMCWLQSQRDTAFFMADDTVLGLENERLKGVPVGSDVSLSVTLERIQATSGLKVLSSYGLTRFGTEEEEIEKFGKRVEKLIAEKKEIKLYIGCGLTIRPGFLHIDLTMPRSNLVEHEYLGDLFNFPIGGKLPIPDNCVDFVLNEDFIEHLPQMIQVKFLAEMRRILKPSAVNRINTPCILDSMKTHSSFDKGAEGVYEGEWEYWGHVNVLSKNTLREFSEMVGYTDIIFGKKNESVSKHHTGDLRPKGDRHGPDANIFADLIK